MIESKNCNECGDSKGLDEFHRSKNGHLGRKAMQKVPHAASCRR